jgi:hypothetical protein
MERRFASAIPKWGRGDPLDSSVEQWRDVYGKIEEVRAKPGQEGLRALAATFSKRGAITAEALGFQVTACHAVAEALLRDPRGPEDLELAGRILKACPPQGWARPYFDVLAEAQDEDPDATLAFELASKALDLAEEQGEERYVQKGLRLLRGVWLEAPPELARLRPNVMKSVDSLPELLGAEDLAPILGLSLVHTRRLLTSGEIPSRKRGRKRYVRKEDFLALFEPERPGRRKPRRS